MRRYACALLFLCITAKADHRGTQFIGFTTFEQFRIETNATGVTLLSPELRPQVNWNELVPSWNFTGTNGLRFEAKAVFPDHETKWYSFGDWAAEATGLPRQSVRNQQDADADVLTDTLRLKQSGGSVRARITLRTAKNIDGLRLLAFSFCDTTSRTGFLDPQTDIWGKTLRVPERSQASYPEGINSWCGSS